MRAEGLFQGSENSYKFEASVDSPEALAAFCHFLLIYCNVESVKSFTAIAGFIMDFQCAAHP